MYIKSINLIPFKQIISYITGSDFKQILINIFGNLLALMPLSFLLLLKDNKYQKIYNIFLKLFAMIFVIELFQMITFSGRFDIDDFILNLTILIINTIIVYELLTSLNLNPVNDKNIFYVETLDDCNTFNKLMIGNRKVILTCINVTYEDEKNVQRSLEDILKENIIPIDYFKENFSPDAAFYNDGGSKIYKSTDFNLSVLYCKTINGNNDIYIGNSELKYESGYCK